MGLQTLVSRVNDPKNTFVLTVGMMNGGTQSNIIADKTVLVGTTRALVNDFRKKIPGLIENLSKNLVKAYGCTADLTYFFGPDPLDNSHHELNEIGRAAYRYMLGGDALVPMRKQMGAEDFSVYMAKTAGVFGFLGTRNEAKALFILIIIRIFVLTRTPCPMELVCTHILPSIIWLGNNN